MCALTITVPSFWTDLFITCYGPAVPRPRTFDEDRALDAAMRTFWANGYEATSTEDLCAATGLGRSSIYNTFTSKHELFRRALLRYVDMMTANQLGILEDEGRAPVERLRALFAAVIDGEMATRRDGRSIGCLSVNSTVELAGRDPEAAEILDRDGERRAAGLRIVIDAGLRAGEITSRRDADALARYLNAVIAGIRVAGQSGADRAALQSIADTALDVLTG
jgi:TetR/AcrR family transcriptional regulator, transcriptional repressor for nem operon